MDSKHNGHISCNHIYDKFYILDAAIAVALGCEVFKPKLATGAWMCRCLPGRPGCLSRENRRIPLFHVDMNAIRRLQNELERLGLTLKFVDQLKSSLNRGSLLWNYAHASAEIQAKAALEVLRANSTIEPL